MLSQDFLPPAWSAWTLMANNYCFVSAASLARRVRRGDVSPTEVVEAHLDRIDRHNSKTNAYITVLRDRARERAHEAERAVRREDELGALHGVPVAIKDMCPVADVGLTFGSRPFANNVAEEDAVIVERLRDAGAIVLGKTNTPEFGHKGTTDNKLHGPTATPFDTTRNAGGSSGGSAAAVADGLAAIGQGSDGGGSIRIPAACCGVYGFKPSFGRVPLESRPDRFLMHTPFVHRGPLTRTVEDAALVLDVVVGPHSDDPFSLPDTENVRSATGEQEADRGYRSAVGEPIDDLEIAYSPDLGLFPVEEIVRSVVEEAVDAFQSAGATIERATPDISPDGEAVEQAWLLGAEVHNAALADGLAAETAVDFLGADREAASDAFIDLVDRGMDHAAIEYKRVQRIRTAVYNAINDLFEEYDLLVTPTLAVDALRPEGSDTLGPDAVAGEPVNPLIGWALAYPFNQTGHPAASIPAGFYDGATPIGLQVVGPRHADRRVLAASAAFEEERQWQTAYPPRE